MDTSGLQTRIYNYNPQMVNFTAGYPNGPHPSGASDEEDEPGGSANDGAGTGNDLKRKASQWHRMKWTDTMVKLLIMAVYYIGDEAGVATNSSEVQKNGKGSCSAAAAQKKGKWKSVSKAMMEKGYCVSPQQCEDKFNDLNKRYKRVNDILGRGTACKVVENQTILESMDLAPKLKEEARKLLNSKHLFFREMCAYHNSCAHQPHPEPEKLNQNPVQFESEGEEEDELECSEDDWEAEEEGEMRKRMKGEVLGVIGDGSKTAAEKRVWMMGRMVELEEEGVRFQAEALEIEKQRWKWARYCRKKEMEMEKKKVVNERMRLENQRMTLLLRQKELEFL